MTKSVDGAFLRTLQEHRQGEILTELSEGMRKAVEAAKRVGKTASMTLEVKFTPNGNAIGLTAEVDLKLPREAPFAGIFFADDAHNLFRRDPTQEELPALRVAEGELQSELKKATNE